MATTEKPILNVCFIGHVDSGKSTTVGNLAFQLGAIDPRKMEKLKKEAADRGRSTFSYAYVMDMSVAERDRGITITTSLMKLETSMHMLNVIDCPGHKDFIKNMVTGAAQADVGVVLVPCATNEFESCISGGTLKDHIMISGVLGCRKLIVCINKCDMVDASRMEARFDEVKSEMLNIIAKCHPDKDPIVIPISGFNGINIVEKGEKYAWFKGWKPKNKADATPIFTLEGALNAQIPPPRLTDKPLRMPIDTVHKISGVGMVCTGRVSSGVMRPGMVVSVQPADVVAEIKTLEVHKTPRSEVLSGENCGVALKAVSKGNITQIKPGHVMSDMKNTPAVICEAARAKVIVVEHPKGIKPGYSPMMDIGTDHVPCQLSKFLYKKIHGVSEEISNPDVVSKGENVTCIIHPTRPTVMETIKEMPPFARFALRDGGRIVGIGAIDKKYTKEEFEKEVMVDKEKGEDAASKSKKEAEPIRRRARGA